MKALAALTLVLVLAACGDDPASSNGSSTSLAGTWEGTLEVEGQDTPVRLTLQEDGNFELVLAGSALSSVTTGTYRVEGNRVQFTATRVKMVDSDGNTVLEMTDQEGDLSDAGPSGPFSIDGDTLTITTVDDDGSTVVLEFRRA